MTNRVMTLEEADDFAIDAYGAGLIDSYPGTDRAKLEAVLAPWGVTIERDVIGRPPSKLIEGDTLVAFGPEDVTGTVTIVEGKPWVTWTDRTEAEQVRGAIAKTFRRDGEVLDWEK
jgi:hypothetical protein